MPVTYANDGKVAIVTFDDGKANAFTISVLDEISAALDRSLEDPDATAVMLAGRDGRFSAGFDLSVMTAGDEQMRELVTAGGRFVAKLLTHPMPVVAACTGHALAAGALVLLAADWRVGASGNFKIGLNEVAIGMPLPRWAVEICRYRMPATEFDRIILGDVGGPENAVRSGFLDEVVSPGEVRTAATAAARAYAELRTGAVAGTKSRARARIAREMLEGIEEDLASVSTPETSSAGG